MAERFPSWIRRPWAAGEDFAFTKKTLEGLNLRTVCQSARCPNQGECWRARTATFMILGDVCTRDCRYCSVKSGAPVPVDADEPERVAKAAAEMNLRHVVVTSVTRDDLDDGGASHFAATVRAVKAAVPECAVEVLTPDFRGDPAAVETVYAAKPEVFGHNVETVARLFPRVRPGAASYERSLETLRTASRLGSDWVVKSAFMVGLGETADEVRETLAHLLDTGCEAVSIGQYLRPTKAQVEVERFVHPDEFAEYEGLAREMGFACAVAGPFVRSSYRSGEMLRAIVEQKVGHGAAPGSAE